MTNERINTGYLPPRPTMAECDALDNEQAKREAEGAAPGRRVQNVVDAIEAFIAAKIEARLVFGDGNMATSRRAARKVDVDETREHLRDKLAELVAP